MEEVSIQLNKEKRNRVIITLIALMVPIALAFITLFILLFFRHYIAKNILGDESIANWLLLIISSRSIS